MSASAALPRRRRRLPTGVVIAIALLSLGGLWGALAPHSTAASAPDRAELVRAGQQLFIQGCSSCHGLQAQGSNVAPSLIGVGGAAVDFQVGTGRMPLARPGAQAERKKPLYEQTDIDRLGAYIGSLAPGPAVPKVDIASGDLAYGGELYRLNCAQCHQATGAGAPLTQGKHAPTLTDVTTTQIGEAIRTGPESMPVFGDGQLSAHDVNSIARYVKFVTHPKDPGGAAIGHYGPVPEGLVAILLGIGGLVIATVWIGSRL